MYCKKCGKELRDEDRFCSNCGTPVPREEVNNETPDPENGKKIQVVDTSEFVWDVHDFNKPARKIENVTVDWEKGTVTEVDDAAREMAEETIEAVTEAVIEVGEDAELIEEVAEAAEEILEDEIEELEEKVEEAVETEEFAGMSVPKIDESFAWTAPIRLDDIETAIEEERAVTLEDIAKDAAPNPNRERDTEKIDKFYTLNKKNEEFQKLLDMEYERIKAGREGSYITAAAIQPVPEEAVPAPVAEEAPAPEPAPEKETPAAPEVFDPVAHLKKAEEERNAALGIAAGTSIAEIAGAYEIQKKNNVYFDDNGEEMRIFDTMELQRDLLDTGTSLKAKNELINDISEKIASTREDVEKTYTSLLDEIFGQISSAGTSTADVKAGVEPEAEGVLIEREDIPEADAYEDVAEEPEEEIIETVEEVPETAETTEPEIAAEDDEIAETDEEQEAILLENGAILKSFYDDEDDEPEKKGGCLKVIIWLVVILLLAEGAVLAIQHFMPDSKAAGFIADKMTAITEMFDKDNDADKDQEDDQDAESPGDEDLPPVDEKEAVTEDKTAVITGLASVNRNIKSITYDADVKYDPDHKYNDDSVKTTVPLTTNVLTESADGVRTYVDEEALRTLIKYNSGWIGYVNEGDKAIFDVLREGSDAWKNTEGFKANGITKVFDSLRIGEIRTDGTGYYVWADETITTTRAGKTTTDEFAWVYYMEPDGSGLEIVDYYK